MTKVKRPSGQPFIKVTSDRPLSEPFIDMLVELSWGSGRLVREYTFLLDPPAGVTQKAAATPVAPVVLPETKPEMPAAAAPAQPEAAQGRGAQGGRTRGCRGEGPGSGPSGSGR